MTNKSFPTEICAEAQVAGASRSRLLRLLRRSDFPGRRKNPELLPLNAADRASRRLLTKIQDEDRITIHRPGRSTYPEEKSVLTSGTTPVSAFLLAQTAVTVVFGNLADIYGRKPVMLAGIAIFTLGSILAGFAWSMPVMILFRLVQGVGAGAMQPVAMIIVADLYPARADKWDATAPATTSP